MTDLPTSQLESRLRMLSDEKCRMIYDAALTIISEMGMTVPHAEAREILVKGAGATVEGEDLVKIPREAVDAARATVPSMIPVYDRGGELAMELGGYNSYFGTGSDLMSIYDFETRERRLSVLDDTARMAHLCDGLPNIDFIMSAAHPHDIEAYASYLECFRAMVSNTTKPMVMTAAGVEDRSLTTWENAERSGPMLREDHIGKVLLVTSAGHMPRAVDAFEHFRVPVAAAPTGFVSGPSPGVPDSLSDLLPSIGALTNSTYAIHEYLGRAWYQVRETAADTDSQPGAGG